MRNLIILLFLFFSLQSFGAMTASGCATKVVTNLKTLNPEITGAAETQLITTWTEICKGIIEEIQNNAVTSTPGVQSGGDTKAGTIQ